MIPVGRILIIPRGEYSAADLYQPLDLVTHNGTSWLCKKTANGIEPNTANTEYWMSLLNFVVVNNLTYTGANGVLDARQGAELQKQINENVVYESVSLLSDANGVLHIPSKDNYEIFSVLSQQEGYAVIGNSATVYLHALVSGDIGNIAPNQYCKVAVTYVKKG